MKMMKWMLALAAAIGLAGSAEAAYNNFSDSALSAAENGKGWKVTTGSSPVLSADKDSTFKYYDGTAGGTDGNNCKPNDRAWMVGANINWPDGAYWEKGHT